MDLSLNSYNTTLVDHNENQILLTARMARDHFFPGRDKNFPEWTLIFAVLKLLEFRRTASPADLFELLKDPSQIESPELRRYLHASIAMGRSRSLGRNRLEVSIFTGERKFSFEKIGGMAAYFASRGQDLCKSKLNILLFYSDFIHYYLYGQSMSGAKYVRHRSGPVIEQYESLLKELSAADIIETGDQEKIVAHDRIAIDRLSALDLVTLHWVKMNFDSMSALDVNRYAYNECAYRFTRRGDYIAYEYSKLFRRLPDPAPAEYASELRVSAQKLSLN